MSAEVTSPQGQEIVHQPEELGFRVKLGMVSAQLDRLEREIDQLDSSGKYPEWWYDDVITPYGLISDLKKEETTPEDIADYFPIYERYLALNERISIHHPGIDILIDTSIQLGTDVVAKGMSAEAPDGLMHRALLKNLELAHDPKNLGQFLQTEVQIVQHLYGTQSAGEVFGIDDTSGYGKQLSLALRSEDAVRAARVIDKSYDQSGTAPEAQAQSLKWMSETLASIADIGKAEAENYMFSTSRRLNVNAENFLSVIDKFKYFGKERIRNITKFTKIHGLEGYSIPQLELMEQVAINPAEAAKGLADHDVSLVLINRAGDYNGMLKDSAELFDDGRNRTLFFEITSLGDVYRHMQTLHKIGIKPSTLALAAHSGPGQFMVYDDRDPSLRQGDILSIAGRNLIKLANEQGISEREGLKLTGYSAHGMKGFTRMIDEYMLPSRGIDDAEANKGKKVMVFQACSAGEDTEMNDKNEAGERVQIGVESVVGQLANDLAANGAVSSVDIYGAPSGIQLHKTSDGVRFSGDPVNNFGGVRVPIHAVKASVLKGKVIKQNVDSVVLHKAA